MARKFPFEFDFDEDADPVDELHRLRVASTKHFKTLDAMMEYHNSLPPVNVLLAEIQEEIAENKAKERAARIRMSQTAKTAKAAKTARTAKASTPARRRKTAKRLTPV